VVFVVLLAVESIGPTPLSARIAKFLQFDHDATNWEGCSYGSAYAEKNGFV
jgi:hypothetical protein